MRIFYHCYGGTHSSVAAAGIHLGLLPRDRKPSHLELSSLKYFDRRSNSEVGKIVYMGIDHKGNYIYVVGRHNRPTLFFQVVDVLTETLKINSDEILMVDVSPQINLSMRIGGFISRRLGWIRIGRPIVTWGTLKSYNHLVTLVDKVYATLKKNNYKKKPEIIPLKISIFYTNGTLPLSFVAAEVLTNKLPKQFDPKIISSVLNLLNIGFYSRNKVFITSKTGFNAHKLIAATNIGSKDWVFKNLINTFLEIFHLDNKQYNITAFNTPWINPSLTIGLLLLKSYFFRNKGKKLVEIYIEKVYPSIVKTVELDCPCQISDNEEANLQFAK